MLLYLFNLVGLRKVDLFVVDVSQLTSLGILGMKRKRHLLPLLAVNSNFMKFISLI